MSGVFILSFMKTRQVVVLVGGRLNAGRVFIWRHVIIMTLACLMFSVTGNTDPLAYCERPCPFQS
jgi:hypothetical protein